MKYMQILFLEGLFICAQSIFVCTPRTKKCKGPYLAKWLFSRTYRGHIRHIPIRKTCVWGQLLQVVYTLHLCEKLYTMKKYPYTCMHPYAQSNTDNTTLRQYRQDMSSLFFLFFCSDSIWDPFFSHSFICYWFRSGSPLNHWVELYKCFIAITMTMHAHIHPCMHACIHTYTHTYTHTYIHTYIHACMHVYTYTYIHTFIRTYIYYIHTNTHRVNKWRCKPSVDLSVLVDNKLEQFLSHSLCSCHQIKVQIHTVKTEHTQRNGHTHHGNLIPDSPILSNFLQTEKKACWTTV